MLSVARHSNQHARTRNIAPISADRKHIETEKDVNNGVLLLRNTDSLLLEEIAITGGFNSYV